MDRLGVESPMFSWVGSTFRQTLDCVLEQLFHIHLPTTISACANRIVIPQRSGFMERIAPNSGFKAVLIESEKRGNI